MPPEIDESNHFVTLVNALAVDPDRHQELPDVLNEATEQTMRTCQASLRRAFTHRSTERES